MSIETPAPSKAKGGMKTLFTKKVLGVPLVYIIGAFVVILAIVAWKIKPDSSGDDAAANEDADTPADDAEATDGAEQYPGMPTGTVVVQPTQLTVPEAEYFSNDDWLKRGVQFLIKRNVNPGLAQDALQTYLSGDDLTVEQGKLRDDVVREFGLPPETFSAGKTSLPVKPSPPPTPVKPPPTPQPAPKPAPPKTRYHTVKSGENLTLIARKYGTTWQKIYAVAANKKVIGRNPNLIRPGQRLIIP